MNDLRIDPASRRKISAVLLLGGGLLLRETALWLSNNNVDTRVLVAPRHAKELHSGLTLVEFLEQSSIDYFVASDLSDSSLDDLLPINNETIALSLGAPWIFTREQISKLFGRRLFNVHGARLPQDRGGGGLSWQIMRGNRFGFCAIHEIDGGIDTGPIVKSAEFLFPAGARTPADRERIYLDKTIPFVQEFLADTILNGPTYTPIVQPEWFSSYWPRLNTDQNGWINWSWKAEDLERFICAFDEPYSGASTLLRDSQVRLRKVCLATEDSNFHPYQNGLIYRTNGSWACVVVQGATLVVEEVRDTFGTNLIDQLTVGDRFITPSEQLDKSLARHFYYAGQ